MRKVTILNRLFNLNRLSSLKRLFNLNKLSNVNGRFNTKSKARIVERSSLGTQIGTKIESIRSYEMLYIFWGVFLLFLTSQIDIPLKPVPITLQTFGVMLVGLIFERKTAIKSILMYLLLGIAGAPVFAHFSGGYLVLLGPTGGYLFGFVMAVIVMTTLKEHIGTKGWLQIGFNVLLGTVTIFICGIFWLAKSIGLNQAIEFGLFPFILPGIIKMALLVVTVKLFNFGNKQK